MNRCQYSGLPLNQQAGTCSDETCQCQKEEVDRKVKVPERDYDKIFKKKESSSSKSKKVSSSLGGGGAGGGVGIGSSDPPHPPGGGSPPSDSSSRQFPVFRSFQFRVLKMTTLLVMVFFGVLIGLLLASLLFFNTASNPVTMAYGDYLNGEFSNLEFYGQVSEEQLDDFYKNQGTLPTITNYESCLRIAAFLALYSDEHGFACIKAGGLYEQAANVADSKRNKLMCCHKALDLYITMKIVYNNNSAISSIKDIEDQIRQLGNSN